MDKATLAFCILINQRQRNTPIGVTQDTQLQRGLSAYVRSTHKANVEDAIKRMVRAVYLKALIEQSTILADRLVDHITANIEDDEIRRSGLETMANLEAYTNHLGSELEAIL